MVPTTRSTLPTQSPRTSETVACTTLDPPPHRQEDFGTCYMATSREGALIETLGGIRPLSQRHLDARVVTDMVVPGGLRIADLTEDREAWLWNADEAWRGAWGNILGLDDYPITQKWAEVLHDAGFHGVQYKPNHNPHQPTYSVVALWSEPGVQHDVVKSEGSERLTNLSLTWLLQWAEILIEENLADGGSRSERESEDESGDEPTPTVRARASLTPGPNRPAVI